MKLGIGAAQFGLNYGVSNAEGITPIAEVAKILQQAESLGIEMIDTAPAYGNSETVLGSCIQDRHRFKIIIKTPFFDKDVIREQDVALLRKTFISSLHKLRQASVYGLLIHHAYDLFAVNGQKLWKSMEALKDEGLVKKIGVSVYDTEQIDEALKRYSIDLIQVPVNIFDQRLLKSGHLKKLKDRHIEVHARSIFLQGLLFMEPSQIPPYLSHAIPYLQKYHDIIKPINLSALDAALTFVDHLKEIDTYIVGLNNYQQLEDILSHLTKNIDKTFDLDYSNFAITDESIINPFLWGKM
ncbi:aldo/keto reductase [Desulfobacterium sp. N47]|uniref:NADP-dependent oxidoreductase domain-containing protein n=1 Tax=uncultured Desulfobacterium sp. TaxID=201089 RepID=E1YGW9_9BACT|nr:hypothetical protein N47_F15080 [uncultured Desulfobacterium sp.]